MNGKIKHTNKKMERPREWLCKHNQGACGFGRIAFPVVRWRGREAGRLGGRGVEGEGGRGGVTFGVGAAVVDISQATNTV